MSAAAEEQFQKEELRARVQSVERELVRSGELFERLAGALDRAGAFLGQEGPLDDRFREIVSEVRCITKIIEGATARTSGREEGGAGGGFSGLPLEAPDIMVAESSEGLARSLRVLERQEAEFLRRWPSLLALIKHASQGPDAPFGRSTPETQEVRSLVAELERSMASRSLPSSRQGQGQGMERPGSTRQQAFPGSGSSGAQKPAGAGAHHPPSAWGVSSSFQGRLTAGSQPASRPPSRNNAFAVGSFVQRPGTADARFASSPLAPGGLPKASGGFFPSVAARPVSPEGQSVSLDPADEAGRMRLQLKQLETDCRGTLMQLSATTASPTWVWPSLQPKGTQTLRPRSRDRVLALKGGTAATLWQPTQSGEDFGGEQKPTLDVPKTSLKKGGGSSPALRNAGTGAGGCSQMGHHGGGRWLGDFRRRHQR